MDLKAFKAGIKGRTDLCLVGPMVTSLPQSLSQIPQILVDGGTKLKRRHSLHFSVGDGDSWGKKLDLSVSPHKDYSDLALALSLVPKHIKCLHLIGFWGGREDHELINLGEISHFLRGKKQTECKLWSGKKTLFWCLSKGEYRFQHTGNFSLFCFGPAKVSLKGKCEYPLRARMLKAHSSHGLSNVGFGSLKLKSSSPLFVIFPHGKGSK